ncbi:CDP-diacylglycerol--glycerol-3-phosphate 3-phosphatidyltransferase [Sinanaerobacter chloroacetimidivorans]|uniref:CDP-diacylglycerol--glycerol-3-phosphate 3-phosphatidyltransferase n=1 Tax=Sinanaerobacter chloroacetimidivorans TaxID=2818044 RepID=A0A8J8B1S3_9FIRM|nr:CDP-diacylglycerol--glycerol-3-phosphate 3-phosphatidyltransferase [Sinanaerobacter chloroacetimidivorans]MBR0596545.1 CDP-diacylglycerol--glycerol-3-phosphate 3-phosphatidyltransferase [Sinanaerobacter chloroacetimidivorans]
MNLPNKLTLLRIILIPVFIIVLMTGYYYISAVIFIVASATDALDGHIARKYNLITNFGKIMDPLADKLLVVSALICLVELGDVAGWMVIVILAREFTVTGLRAVAAAQGIVIAAGWSGKIKTVLQMIAVPALLLKNWPFVYVGIPFADIMLWASVIMTIVSGTEYVIKNKQVFKA